MAALLAQRPESVALPAAALLALRPESIALPAAALLAQRPESVALPAALLALRPESIALPAAALLALHPESMALPASAPTWSRLVVLSVDCAAAAQRHQAMLSQLSPAWRGAVVCWQPGRRGCIVQGAPELRKMG